MKISQKYYSVCELAWTYSFSTSTIRQWMRDGKFGPQSDFLQIGNDIRVPASGCFHFEQMHKKVVDAATLNRDRVKGRTLGEARRRAQQAVPSSVDNGC